MAYTYCGKCNANVLVGGLSHIFTHEDKSFCCHKCYMIYIGHWKTRIPYDDGFVKIED